MRSLLAVLLCLLATLVVGQPKFDTERFDASYDVAKDGTVNVVETIAVRFKEPQRGLIRRIPVNTKSSAGDVRAITVSVLGVTSNGKEAQVQSTEQGGDASIRIGSADTFLSGRVEYQLRYSIRGAITPITKQDQLGRRTEFFWNLLPTNWPTEIPHGTIAVTWPQPEPGRLLARVLAGPRGTRQGIQVERGKAPIGRSDFLTVEMPSDTKLVVELKRPLPANNVVTAAIALPGDTVVPPAPTIRRPSAARSVPLNLPKGSPWLGLIAAAPGVLVALLTRRYWPARERPLVVKFDAPPGMSPSLSGTVIDGKVDPRDVVAGIVSLAQKRAIRLHHPQVEGGGIQIELLGLERARDVEYIEQYIYGSLAQYGGLISSDMLRGSFGANYQQIQSLLEREAVDRGLFTQRGKAVAGFGCLLVLLVIVSVFALCIFQPIFSLLGAGFSLLVGFFAISRISYVTPQGQLVRRELQGLKEFITRAQQQEMNYMADVEPDQALFEKLLPYAIAFDAVQQWTEAFRGIDLQIPEWYDAPLYGDMFWTTMLLHDLTHFSHDYGNAMSYTPPPTSDFGTGDTFSSGGSAFGDDSGWSDSGGGGFDGGFSGGDGGGGGGGDSW